LSPEGPGTPQNSYKIKIRDLPQEQKPGEKMNKYSPGALKNYELLSMVLGKGTRKEGLFGIARRAVDELKNEFQRCHDAIWQGGKLDSAQAFDEMSKLLFTKYFDEL